jgi:DNA polymerase-3 subunit epsilon
MCRSLSGVRVILRLVSHTWGRPVREADAGWVVVDVETSGFHPRNARVLSVAALALDAQGNVEHSVVSLLNPGVDPGPTHVHGLTSEMLEDQPTFADIADDLAALMHGRTLVAHNAAFKAWPICSNQRLLIGSNIDVEHTFWYVLTAECNMNLMRPFSDRVVAAFVCSWVYFVAS